MFKKWTLPFLAVLASAGQAGVIVSEIHYHPVEEPVFNSSGTPVLDLTDDVHEFVELQNTGPIPADVGGWTLAGGVDLVIPAGTVIPAGGFQVIAKNPQRIQSVYALPAGSVLGPFTGKLGNDGDTIRIKDAAGATQDEVSYSGHFPWAESANALGAQDRFTGLNSAAVNYKGRSLQRVSIDSASNDPANWLAAVPTPGSAQALTRAFPKPVVVAQSRTQTSNGSTIIRASAGVTVRASFSSTLTLSQVHVEYFVDDVNSTGETRSTVLMTGGANGTFTALLPGQPDRRIVRYRFKADRGEGVEVVSPRPDDPQIAPIGPGGALEAWHGYFVTPSRTSSAPAYDVLVGTAQLSRMDTNINQSPRRVTTRNATGLPREVPYVPATAPLWNGTVPAVFASNGEIRDIHLRYHGSRYHRATTNLSFKIHFPENQPFRGVTSFFITGHADNTAETQKIYRLLDLPASLTRTVDWYFNSATAISRLEHGEYERHVLEEWTARQQQLSPGSTREDTGEFYKAIGNIETFEENTEGPYTVADQSPMRANAGWNQLQRYEWTYSLQNNAWKGHRPFRDLIEGMWTARGDSPDIPALAGNSSALTATRAWLQANFDVDATLTSLAVCQWTGIWDDVGHNQFFWRRANGKWVRLPWDFDDTMSSGRTTQSIYANEMGVEVFIGPSWFKDTFFKCFRNEFRQRLWELNNSFLDPVNLNANALPTAASFASTRQANVNNQIGLGVFNKPARPVNTSPANASRIVGGAILTGSTYSHPAARAHLKTKWEIRLSTGDFEEPEVRLVTTSALTSLSVPFDQLVWGQTYYWRVTYYDADNHASIVSPETSFVYGTASTSAGTLVLNEVLADNRSAVENGSTHPDFVEIHNNGSSAASLAGLSLTDDPLVPAKFGFPADTTLDPGASLIVWCDSAVSAPGLHSGFGLNADGQTVLLLNGGTILDAVAFGPQAPDISIGRIVNGTGGWQANAPTPGEPNVSMPLGSSASLRFNEWMASPPYGDDWFELYNPGTLPVALGGLFLSDDPAFATNTKIPPLSFIAPGGFTKFLADGSTAGGHHVNFKLGGGGDNLVLTDFSGLQTIDLVTFGAQVPETSQGHLPDGSGPLTSFPLTSSPAGSNWLPAPVVINEVLANSTAPFADTIELHNPSDVHVSIGGWWLSDDHTVPKKFRIPAGTTILPGGYLTFSEDQFNAGAAPFSLSSLGDEVSLSAADGVDNLTGLAARVNFGASAENVSFGRVPVTGGTEFWPQTARTPDAPNALPKTTPLLINEIMYHPADGPGGVDNTRDEFVEIFNSSPVSLDVSGWRLKGGSDFTFPPSSSIPAGAFALLVSFDPADSVTLAAFLNHYALPGSTLVFGPYLTKLSNSTQNLEIAFPGPPAGTDIPFINVDKVVYRDLAPWDPSADGTSFSLQRESRLTVGNDPANWTGAAPTPAAVNAAVIGDLTIVTNSPVSGGVAGIAYTHTLSAAGGSPPYTWTISSGSLPGGIAVSTDGALTGIPAAAGVYSFTAQVTDAAATVKEKSLTLTISDTVLEITTASLPDGVFGTAYSQPLSASGGNPAYIWTLQSGSLPTGLTLSNAGVVSGIPGAHGSYQFTIRVTDSGALLDTHTYTVVIPVPPLVILNASPLPEASVGVLYSQTLLAAGGIAPYTWTVSAGALPSNVTLAGSGVLSGTSTAPGTFNFTARLTDSISGTLTKSFSLVVRPATLVITSAATLPAGFAGELYSRALTATGGTLPYFWALTEGQLPPGINLNSNGSITGTPSAPGTFEFTARNSDSGGQTASKSFTLTIGTSGPLDHFTWDYFPASVAAGTPFATRITARDAQNRIVAAFSGNVNLAAGAVPLTPASVTLKSGEWIGYLTVGQVATAVRITASSGTVTGASPLFNVSSTPADSDGDGIPNSWEISNGLNPGVHDSTLDLDGDGMSNGAEFRFGTDPRSPSSVTAITAFLVSSNTVTVTWPAIAGKLYRVATTADGVTWQYTPALATATGPRTATVSTGLSPRLIVRVEIAP